MTEARRIAFELIRPEMACSELDGRVNEFLGASRTDWETATGDVKCPRGGCQSRCRN